MLVNRKTKTHKISYWPIKNSPRKLSPSENYNSTTKKKISPSKKFNLKKPPYPMTKQ
jgi:hypothetical protein